MRSLFLIILTLSFALSPVFADQQTDSLRNIRRQMAARLATVKDSARADLLNDLAQKYKNESLDTTMLFARQALKLSQSLGYLRGQGFAHKSLGQVYYLRGDNLEAVNSWKTASGLFAQAGNDSLVAVLNGNIGAVYYNQGDESTALDYYIKALQVGEQRHDTMRIVTMCNNIGALYYNKAATRAKALFYYFKALELSPSLPYNNPDLADFSTELAANVKTNIGEVYLAEDTSEKEALKFRNLDSAIYFFNQAIKGLRNTTHAPYTLNNLGKGYRLKGDFQHAIQYHKESFEVAKSYDARDDMANAMLGLAVTYQQQGDLDNALRAYQKSEKYSLEADATYYLKSIYQGLSAIYSKRHDYIHAFQYQTKLINVKDSIYNLETDKKLGTLQFTFDIQKKESEINLLTADKKNKDLQIAKERLVRNSFIGGFAIMVLFAGIFFRQRNRISKEKKRSDELLLNILPEETAEELKQTGKAQAKSYDLVTVMFTDFKNFTQASERLSPEELVEEINRCYSEFDKIVTHYGIEKIKTIGDAYMCVGGLPAPNNTHPVDVVHAGLDFQAFIAENKRQRENNGLPFFELRLGIHTGPVVAGIVGIKKFAYDIWGDTVNTASRMESSGETGKVNISGVTYELIKDHFTCTHRGKVKAKNKGEIDMYFVDARKV